MEEMIFENIRIFWLLLIIPISFGLFVLLRFSRKKQLAKLGSSEVLKKMMIETSNARPWLKFSLLMLVFVFLIIALARPQFATETKIDANENVEIIIAIDISNSMLAASKNVNVSRLTLAKTAIDEMINVLENERVGLIVFAGQAVVQIPLTRDYSAFRLILNSLEPGFISAQGTAIGDAIELSLNSFSQEEGFNKSIIIISDGEDHEGNIDRIIDLAKKDAVQIFTLGIGSKRGSSIIIDGKPLTDKNGKIIVSKLNEDILRKISKETDGKYSNFLGNTKVLKDVYKNMNKSDKNGKSKVAKYDEKYHYFVIIALFFLLVEFFILTRKNRWIAKIRIFEKIK
ncbi:MAG: VWA domain-containing protein [Bacteroidota bacterium]|nr:VWA domain-containing protein [Bacteroidota bacterium]